jgi:hypothetical protein
MTARPDRASTNKKSTAAQVNALKGLALTAIELPLPGERLAATPDPNRNHHRPHERAPRPDKVRATASIPVTTEAAPDATAGPLQRITHQAAQSARERIECERREAT